jgi:predicted amidohydrolase
MIDGTGAPPQGPVDIVVENNRIAGIYSVGYPRVPIRDASRPPKGTSEIDATGMFVMPGFVDVSRSYRRPRSGHNRGVRFTNCGWLTGVTTVREPGSMNGVDWTLRERERSSQNKIVAPRIFVYVVPGSGWEKGQINSPLSAVEYVQWAKRKVSMGSRFSKRRHL